MRANGEVEIDSKEDTKSMPPLEDTDEEEYAVEGELLVARRALSVQIKEDEEV